MPAKHPKCRRPDDVTLSQRAPPSWQALLWLLAAGGLFAVLLIAIYGRAMRAPFIYDDEDIILKNASIERLWPLIGAEPKRGPLNPPREISTAGRPLVNFSLAVNYFFGQKIPAGYHIFNLLLHIATTLLLLGVMRRTLRLEFFTPEIQRAADILAFAVALVWSVHPLHTETVIYVTQRTELSVSFFYLATLYASLRYWTADNARGQKIWIVVATIACTLGMGCKEVMATAPVVVLLFERTFVTGSFRDALVRSWRLYARFLLAWLVLLLLNYSAPRAGSAGFHTDVIAVQWWLTQTKILLLYLKLFVWPWPLVVFYQFPYLTSVYEAWPWLVPVLILIVGTVMLCWRRTAVGFALAWMFLILSPTLLVPIKTEMAAERRMYLPSAALVAVMIVGAYWLATQLLRKTSTSANTDKTVRRSLAIVLVGTLMLGGLYSALDVRRATAYIDPIVLWEDAARYQNNATVQTNWGVALAAAGKTDEAIEHYRQALRLDPETREAGPNLAEAYYDLGLKLLDRNDPVAAIERFQTALSIKPDFPNAYYALATAKLAQHDLPAAAEHLATAVRLRPDYVEALVNLGIVQLNLGASDRAAESFQTALRHSPDNADAHFGLAMCLVKLGQAQPAAEHFQATYRADPRRADAHFELANLCVAAQDLRRAREEFQAAVQVKPDYVAAWQNLGAVSLALGDTKQAIAQLTEALRFEPDNPQARANLERALEPDRQPK